MEATKQNAVKGAMKSKTIWFGIGLEVLGVIQLQLPTVQEQLGPYYGWILIAAGIGVKVLRGITTDPLSKK